MTNKTIKDFAPYIAAFAALGAAAAAATVAYVKTSNALKELDHLELDFGNDDGITSMFNRKDNK
jgi:hypothetical protein